MLATYETCAYYTEMNECDTDNGGCSQLCTNRDGDFVCSCNAGFTLLDDNINCEGNL